MQRFFTDSGETRHQQEKLITPSNSQYEKTVRMKWSVGETVSKWFVLLQPWHSWGSAAWQQGITLAKSCTVHNMTALCSIRTPCNHHCLLGQLTQLTPYLVTGIGVRMLAVSFLQAHQSPMTLGLIHPMFFVFVFYTVGFAITFYVNLI